VLAEHHQRCGGGFQPLALGDIEPMNQLIAKAEMIVVIGLEPARVGYERAAPPLPFRHGRQLPLLGFNRTRCRAELAADLRQRDHSDKHKTQENITDSLRRAAWHRSSPKIGSK